MSKSIYENAIGQLLKIQGRLSTNYDKFLEVKQALEQAQKQEKLLNEIKDIVNRPDYFFYSNVRRIKKICQDYIKLEKENKENE